MNIELKTYTTTIDTKPFSKQKGYYIKETDILTKANKVKIRLPWSLNRKDEVDVYGVKNGKYRLYRSKVKVEDKYISFEPSEDFQDYFITYIPLKNITIKNKINVEIGDEIILNYKFSPSNATNKSITFKQSKKLLTINGSKITATKKGETTLTVTNRKSGISTSVKIIVTKPEPEPEPEPEPTPTPQNNTVTQVDGLYYVDGILLANKTYPLTSSYDPGDLLDEFYNAFYNMQAAAELDGIQLWIQSGYRDYETQEIIYNRYVASDGQELADTYSARPGYSEHQTGLAADINNPSDSFNDTAEAKWLEENCAKYGFIIRFPRGKEAYTGYQYESWHIRYVGVEKAKAITDSGLSLEEYYGITSVYQ
jgi:LAS superfamily LD-carboxypeptidase LdcB